MSRRRASACSLLSGDYVRAAISRRCALVAERASRQQGRHVMATCAPDMRPEDWRLAYLEFCGSPILRASDELTFCSVI